MWPCSLVSAADGDAQRPTTQQTPRCATIIHATAQRQADSSKPCVGDPSAQTAPGCTTVPLIIQKGGAAHGGPRPNAASREPGQPGELRDERSIREPRDDVQRFGSPGPIQGSAGPTNPREKGAEGEQKGDRSVVPRTCQGLPSASILGGRLDGLRGGLWTRRQRGGVVPGMGSES